MIATKGQRVQLTDEAVLLSPNTPNVMFGTATVVSIDTHGAKGERSVYLDRQLGGSSWWAECDLEAVSRD